MKKIRLQNDLYCQPGRIYFVTINSNFRKPVFVEPEFNNAIITCLLNERKSLYEIHVYCLMPDHIHFLVSAMKEKDSIKLFVNRFKGISTRIAWQYGIDGVLWQRRFYDHILRRDEEVGKIGQYILNNPVRRGLVPGSDVYEYCGVV
jgi:putative transposase